MFVSEFEYFIKNFEDSTSFIKSKAKRIFKEFIENNPVEIPSLDDRITIYNETDKVFNITIDGRDPLETLIHEMSHIAEIGNPKRLLKKNFGFENDYYFYEPAIKTELKVFAYEINLFKYLKVKFPIEKLQENVELIAYDSEDKEDYPNERVRTMIKELFPQYQKIYTIGKFRKEWNKKMEFLKNLEI